MEEESAPLVDASNSSSNNATTEAIAAGSSAGASMASKASGPQVLIPLEESVQGELGDAHAQEAGSYGPYAAYAFTINYVLGSGVLGLGYAFYNGGTFASWWILMAASFLSAVSMLFIVDASARAHGLSTVVPVSADLTHGVKIEHLTKPSVPSWHFRPGKLFEMNLLMKMFSGVKGSRAWEIALGTYLYGAMTGYAAVFASSFTESVHLPGLDYSSVPGGECNLYAEYVPEVCVFAYRLYMVLFALLVIPLSLKDLAEQVIIQALLCLFRFVAIAIMVVTTLRAAYIEPYDPLDSPHETPPYWSTMKWLDQSGLGIAFTVAMYSQITHHAAPGIVAPMKNKASVKAIFLSVFLSTFAVYSLLGSVTSLYFGSHTEEVISFNWLHWDGYIFGAKADVANRPQWATFLSYIIVLFPPIDIVSAYPLNGITLGNTFFQAIPRDLSGNGTDKAVKRFCRLAASIPPLIVASLVWRLTKILRFCGLAGFFIAFIFPAYLEYKSLAFTTEAYGRKASRTFLTWHFSAPIYTILVGLIASAGFLYVGYDTYLDYFVN